MLAFSIAIAGTDHEKHITIEGLRIGNLQLFSIH